MGVTGFANYFGGGLAHQADEGGILVLPVQKWAWMVLPIIY